MSLTENGVNNNFVLKLQLITAMANPYNILNVLTLTENDIL